MTRSYFSWRVGLAIFLSIVVTSSMIKIFSSEDILIKISLTAEKQNKFQVFYTEPGMQTFAESMSIGFENDQNNSEFSKDISLPIKKMNQLRLDFGEYPGKVTLHSIKINGEEKIKAFEEKLNNCFVNMIDRVEARENGIYIESSQADPVIIFPQMLTQANSEIRYEWMLIISSLVLFYIFFYTVLGYLFNRKIRCSIADMCFVIITGMLLLLPVSKINYAESEAIENRALANSPSFLLKDGKINYSYGKDFESWLNDRFRYRQKLINMHDKIEAVLANRIENSKAFVGKDHWVFYKGDGSVELYQNKIIFNDVEMEKIKINLEQRKRWLHSKGIEYFVLIPPDKSSVYGEFYKDSIGKVRKENRIQLLEKYLEDHGSDVKLNYLLDFFNEHKADGLLYYKTDTHWGEYGAYLGYLSLMKDIQRKFSDAFVLSTEDMLMEKKTKSKGDLTVILGIDNPELYDDTYFVPIPKEGYTFSYEEGNKFDQQGVALKTHNSKRKLKVLVFRDSFANAIAPYLSESFGDVEYIWDHNFNDYQEKIIQESPDIVIHEIVSRSVPVLLKDTPELKGVND